MIHQSNIPEAFPRRTERCCHGVSNCYHNNNKQQTINRWFCYSTATDLMYSWVKNDSILSGLVLITSQANHYRGRQRRHAVSVGTQRWPCQKLLSRRMLSPVWGLEAEKLRVDSIINWSRRRSVWCINCRETPRVLWHLEYTKPTKLHISVAPPICGFLR